MSDLEVAIMTAEEVYEDYTRHFHKGNQDPNRPPEQGEAFPEPPWHGGNDEASLYFAATFLAFFSFVFWLPPLIRLVSSPSRWWRDFDRRDVFRRSTFLKLLPVVGLILVVYIIRTSASEFDDPIDAHYYALGLTRDASIIDVKRSYRKLAKDLHPDKNKQSGRDTRAEYERVQRAYEYLTDPKGRSAEDLKQEAFRKEMESIGQSMALPKFLLEKRFKNAVMVGAFLLVTLPLLWALKALKDSDRPTSPSKGRRGRSGSAR